MCELISWLTSRSQKSESLMARKAKTLMITNVHVKQMHLPKSPRRRSVLHHHLHRQRCQVSQQPPLSKSMRVLKDSRLRHLLVKSEWIVWWIDSLTRLLCWQVNLVRVKLIESYQKKLSHLHRLNLVTYPLVISSLEASKHLRQAKSKIWRKLKLLSTTKSQKSSKKRCRLKQKIWWNEWLAYLMVLSFKCMIRKSHAGSQFVQ